MHDDEYIDFPGLIDQAMRDVVRKALQSVEKHGLPGDHHFFISFRTDYAGVEISDTLRDRHPHEMTIVLQHQFWDLKVEEERFSITLSFNNIPEKLVVPLQAMTAFADPSVKFGLQFHTFLDEELMEELLENEEDLLQQLEEEQFSPSKNKKPKSKDDEPKGEVVTLEAFRKKQQKKKSTDKSKK